MSSEDTTVFAATVAPPQASAVEVDTGRGRWRDSLIVLGWSVVMAAVIFLPLLRGRGVALIGDMVFVPNQSLEKAWLGLDGGSTAHVPADFFVSLLSYIAPGDIIQKIALISAVLVAGTGAGAAVSHLGLAPRLAAATLYVWNPFVFERLAVGDWTMVASYSVLPWIVWAARRTTTGSIGEWAPIVVFIAFAGWLNPLGGFLALVLGVILLVGRSATGVLFVLLAGFVVNLPSLVPALLRRGGPTVDPAAVQAYALSTDGGLGLIGNVLTLGGIWNDGAVPAGRDKVIVVALALVLTAVAVVGALLLTRRSGGGVVVGLFVFAAIGAVIALLGALNGGRTLIENLAENVPGGSLLVVGHAWLAPVALLLAVGLAGLVKEVAGRAPGAGALVAVAVVAIAAPIALLPAMALGLDGRLENVNYPGEWSKVREKLIALDPVGTLVVPLDSSRTFQFNDEARRTSADPATRFFPGDVVVDDSASSGRVLVPGSDPRVEAIRAGLERGGDLQATLLANGIDTVVREINVPGKVPQLRQLDGTRDYEGERFVIVTLNGTPAAVDRPAGAAIIAADIAAALVALGALGAWIIIGRRRRAKPLDDDELDDLDLDGLDDDDVLDPHAAYRPGGATAYSPGSATTAVAGYPPSVAGTGTGSVTDAPGPLYPAGASATGRLYPTSDSDATGPIHPIGGSAPGSSPTHPDGDNDPGGPPPVPGTGGKSL